MYSLGNRRSDLLCVKSYIHNLCDIVITLEISSYWATKNAAPQDINFNFIANILYNNSSGTMSNVITQKFQMETANKGVIHFRTSMLICTFSPQGNNTEQTKSQNVVLGVMAPKWSLTITLHYSYFAISISGKTCNNGNGSYTTPENYI